MRILKDGWRNHQVIGTHRFEMTPFHFHGELYLLENFCDYEPAGYPADQYPERTARDGFLIRRYRDGKLVGDPVRGCYFAGALAHEGRLYVFASAFDAPRFTAGVSFRRLVRYTSDDLVHWSEPVTVFRHTEPGCMIFNTGTVWDGRRFVGVYETNEASAPLKFLFKFMVSDDLEHFTPVPGGEYGREKYVGANALYFAGEYYYLLYLHDRLDRTYETRVSRSRDLVHWEDAPADRPVMEPDPSHEVNPVARPGVMELNASDLELIEENGRTLAFWLGGDQHGCCDLQTAENPASMQELLEHYFR